MVLLTCQHGIAGWIAVTGVSSSNSHGSLLQVSGSSKACAAGSCVSRVQGMRSQASAAVRQGNGDSGGYHTSREDAEFSAPGTGVCMRLSCTGVLMAADLAQCVQSMAMQYQVCYSTPLQKGWRGEEGCGLTWPGLAGPACMYL